MAKFFERFETLTQDLSRLLREFNLFRDNAVT